MGFSKNISISTGPVISGDRKTFLSKNSLTTSTDILLTRAVMAISEPKIKFNTELFTPILVPNDLTIVDNTVFSQFHRSAISDVQNALLSELSTDSARNYLKMVFARYLQTEDDDNISTLFTKLNSFTNISLLMAFSLIINENVSLKDIILNMNIDGDDTTTGEYSALHFLVDTYLLGSLSVHRNSLLNTLPNVYTTENEKHPVAYQDIDNISEEYLRIYTSINTDSVDFAGFVKNAAGIELDINNPESFIRIDDRTTICDENIWFFSYLYNYPKGLLPTEHSFILAAQGVNTYSKLSNVLNDRLAYYNKYYKNEDEFYRNALFFQKLVDGLSTRTINY